MITELKKIELKDALRMYQPDISLDEFRGINSLLSASTFMVLCYMEEDDEFYTLHASTRDALVSFLTQKEHYVIGVYGHGLPLGYNIITRVDFN